MDKERINELLTENGAMDLKTFYWMVLKEKIEDDSNEEDVSQLKALEEKLAEDLNDDMRAVLVQWMEVQTRLKDGESYASFLAGVRHGMKLFLDILG